MKIFFIAIALVYSSINYTRVKAQMGTATQKPNVIIIYVDDLGYGDLSCYGAEKIKTPNIDRLASSGLKFIRTYSTSATCTPSRYALMTGEYPWRKSGIKILPGDAKLIIPTNVVTLPKIFKSVNYQTGIVGKWHLGLGNSLPINWNAPIKPGPNEIGFDYSFIFPATADRVPTIFLENSKVIAYEPNDPIKVDYKNKVGNEPTGLENPELLKMQASPNHGHNNTIVNGVGRIGFMSGGKMTRWVDEEMPLTFLWKAKEFIKANRGNPFFLYYSLTEPHVPRLPSTMFKGKSGLGLRGDVILQLDWAVGEIMDQLQVLGIADNTIIIFSSDNGPVLDDGYQDEAVEKLNGHKPAGNLRGGKYSAFEAGTRIPFIISWPAKIKSGESEALVSQVDLVASFASFFNQTIPKGDAIDSKNMLNTLLGKDQKGRDELIIQGGALALIYKDWKYIQPNDGDAIQERTGIETGNAPIPQLYNLISDPSERKNVAEKEQGKLKEMEQRLKKYIE